MPGPYYDWSTQDAWAPGAWLPDTWLAGAFGPDVWLPSSGGGGGGGAYVAKAMHLDPNVFMDIAALAASDSPFLTVATFFRATVEAISAGGSGTNLVLIDFYPAGDEDCITLTFGSNGPGALAIGAASFDDNPDNGQSLSLVQVGPTTGYPAFDGEYHSLVFSFDVNHDNAQLSAMYLDRVLIASGNAHVDKPAFSFKFSGAEVGIPDTTSDWNPTPACDLGGYYLAFPGVKIVQDDNTILDADLNRFVTVDNKPVDPATIIAHYGDPAIYLTCDATDLTNHGTGGDIIVTGTPTDTDAP